MIFRKRKLFAVLAALFLATAQPALADKTLVSASVHAKSQSVGEIAVALGETGRVRVLVQVAISSLYRSSIESAVRSASTRAAAQAQIRSAVDAVIESHPLAARSAGRGQPAITRLTTVPAFAVTVSLAELEDLARDPRVVSINYDQPMQLNLNVTLPLIGMSSVYSGGGTGVGYAVAVIDTGVQRDHVFLGTSRIITNREACFLDFNGCPNGTNEQRGAGAGAAAAGQSHGTHVSGIVLGNRASGTPRRGVAPEARLIPINVFGTAGSTSFSTIQRAFEYVEDLVIAGNNSLKIAAINMSVGGGSSPGNCDTDATMALLKPVIDNLRNRGVLSTISAGNSYQTGAMSFPACLSSMVSVAATSRAGVVSSYTNISPTTDLFAPGGEIGDCVLSSLLNNTFGTACGTSMAAPHVAGAIAVLRQKVPTASACMIEEALRATGVATLDTRAGGTITKPRIRVNQALARLLSPIVPANDAFARATVIPADTTVASFAGTNIGATLETGEAHHVVSTSTSSVWWQWTPSFSGPVTISTAGSAFDTVLAVYRGGTTAASPGTLVKRNDNITGATTSEVIFNASAGQTYRIVVASKRAGDQCSIQLNMTRPPANDNFADAREVALTATAEVGIGGTNVGTTKQTGEPDHAGRPGATTTVWFRFTAPVSGEISIDTFGSQLNDTVLAVYTGNTLTSLVAIAANDDDPGNGLKSKVTFNMVAGRTYRVALAGYAGTSGRYRLWFAPAGARALNREMVIASNL